MRYKIKTNFNIILQFNFLNFLAATFLQRSCPRHLAVSTPNEHNLKEISVYVDRYQMFLKQMIQLVVATCGWVQCQTGIQVLYREDWMLRSRVSTLHCNDRGEQFQRQATAVRYRSSVTMVTASQIQMTTT